MTIFHQIFFILSLFSVTKISLFVFFILKMYKYLKIVRNAFKVFRRYKLLFSKIGGVFENLFYCKIFYSQSNLSILKSQEFADFLAQFLRIFILNVRNICYRNDGPFLKVGALFFLKKSCFRFVRNRKMFKMFHSSDL